MKSYKVILLGSKPGSVVVLNYLLQLGWDVVAVVVSNIFEYDWIPGAKLDEEARKKNIPVYTNQTDLPDESVDFVISYMYRHLVKQRTREMASTAAINFHAGPLPEYGGWAFYNLALLEEVKEYGCTCHYMDNGFDTGPLLKVRKFPIEHEKETAVSLERKTQKEMVLLFKEFCELVESEQPLPINSQEESRMRYMTFDEFNRLKEIPHDADEYTVQKYARAFWYPPYQCAYIVYNESKIEVIPTLAKEEIAHCLHREDAEYLQAIFLDLER